LRSAPNTCEHKLLFPIRKRQGSRFRLGQAATICAKSIEFPNRQLAQNDRNGLFVRTFPRRRHDERLTGLECTDTADHASGIRASAAMREQ
jgi:hypothetical protein